MDKKYIDRLRPSMITTLFKCPGYLLANIDEVESESNDSDGHRIEHIFKYFHDPYLDTERWIIDQINRGLLNQSDRDEGAIMLLSLANYLDGIGTIVAMDEQLTFKVDGIPCREGHADAMFTLDEHITGSRIQVVIDSKRGRRELPKKTDNGQYLYYMLGAYQDRPDGVDKVLFATLHWNGSLDNHMSISCDDDGAEMYLRLEDLITSAYDNRDVRTPDPDYACVYCPAFLTKRCPETQTIGRRVMNNIAKKTEQINQEEMEEIARYLPAIKMAETRLKTKLKEARDNDQRTPHWMSSTGSRNTAKITSPEDAIPALACEELGLSKEEVFYCCTVSLPKLIDMVIVNDSSLSKDTAKKKIVDFLEERGCLFNQQSEPGIKINAHKIGEKA